MTPFRARALPAVLFAIGLGAATNAAAQQQLNVICSAQGEWCNAIATEFQRETGIKVAITPKGSGESIAQLAAETRTQVAAKLGGDVAAKYLRDVFWIDLMANGGGVQLTGGSISLRSVAPVNRPAAPPAPTTPGK